VVYGTKRFVAYRKTRRLPFVYTQTDIQRLIRAASRLGPPCTLRVATVWSVRRDDELCQHACQRRRAMARASQRFATLPEENSSSKRCALMEASLTSKLDSRTTKTGHLDVLTTNRKNILRCAHSTRIFYLSMITLITLAAGAGFLMVTSLVIRALIRRHGRAANQLDNIGEVSQQWLNAHKAEDRWGP